MPSENHEVHLKPIHDKPTIVSFGSMASWSWFVYGFGASLALLADEQGSAPWLTGLHAPALALGGVIGALATPRLTHRFGRGVMTRVGAIGASLSILFFVLPGLPTLGTLVGIFLATFFGNIIVVCVNSFISVHQGPAAPPAFTENLALAALMGLLAPAAVGAATAVHLGWRAGLLVAVVMFAGLEIARGRNVAVYGIPGDVVTRKEGGALPVLTYWAVIAGMLYVGAEFCISLWGVTFLRDQTGLGPAAAAAGLSSYLGGLFVGRVLGSGLTRRFEAEYLLRVAMGGGIVMFLVAWLLSAPALVLGFLFLAGVMLSLTWPLSLARIMRSAAGNVDRAAALTLAFTTAAIGIAPFLLATLAGTLSVHVAFLLVPGMLVVAFAVVWFRRVPD